MPLTLGTIAGGARTPFTLNYLGSYYTTTNDNEYDRSVSTGTESADRQLIVCAIGIADGTPADPISSIASFVGFTSTTATKLSEENLSNGLTTAIYIVACPTGTSATIRTRFSGFQTAYSLFTYAAYGLVSATPVSIQKQSGVANPLTIAVSAPSGSQVVSVAGTAFNTGNVWSGVTERGDTGIGSTGSASFTTPQSVNVSYTSGYTSGNSTSIVACFR